MGRGSGRQWGALAAAVLLLAGCSSDPSKPENKVDLSDSLLAAAAASQQANDFLSAANYYRTSLADRPSNRDASLGLMMCLRLIGGLDEATGVADRAAAQWPNDPQILSEAGKVKLAAGKPDEAIVLLKRAIDLNGKDWRTLSALGLAYDRKGDYAAADESYKAALAISPENASILNNYGMSRAMANDLDGARGILLRAVMMPNADVRVRQNLALVYALSGDMAKAEELTRRDLPPALANATLDYYRQLAAAAPENQH